MSVRNKVKYACPCCHQVYSTRREAEKCSVNVVKELKLKEGEFLRSASCSTMYRILHLDDCLNVVEVKDWVTLLGYTWKSRRNHKWALSPFACAENKIRRADVDEVKKELKRRKAQVAAGERLLKAINDSRGVNNGK